MREDITPNQKENWNEVPCPNCGHEWMELTYPPDQLDEAFFTCRSDDHGCGESFLGTLDENCCFVDTSIGSYQLEQNAARSETTRQTTPHDVNYTYAKAEQDAIFRYARMKDVDGGGRYDCASAAINIWTHTWNGENFREESTLIGTVYFSWAEAEEGIWKMEIERGFDFSDLLHELAVLEKHAIGKCKHGELSM